ncbi:hypothetical protein [Streptomyces sp. KL2]|uniref:hypothetical protein n=1 Tax=Streptomyces sp. KL2 TaxID=3050126 RepID=UPI00397B360D
MSDELTSILGRPVTIGAGGPVHGLEDVRKAYQGGHALSGDTRRARQHRGFASVGELGFLGVLLSDDNNTGAFVWATIGPVLDHDGNG